MRTFRSGGYLGRRVTQLVAGKPRMGERFSTTLAGQVSSAITHILDECRREADHSVCGSSRRVLVLCDFHTFRTGTIRDHIAAFKKYSAHDICVADMRSAADLRLDLDVFDVVVLHYSFIVAFDSYFPR